MLEIEEQIDYSFEKWDELDIPIQLLRGIYAYGFESVSPIQKKAIKPIISGRDVIAQAQSGTGKTATFTIGALSVIDIDLKSPQVLILSPTRELTKQTANVINGIGCMMPKLNVQVLIGGTFIKDDMDQMIDNPPHIIAACPGRIFDVIKRNRNITKNIKTTTMK
jgi:superfamily II DNA/RNA helicase